MALPSRSRAAEPASPVEPGPLPVAAAIVPGVLVHGSGHFVAGDADTGWKLLGMQGIGLGMVAAAGIPFALTGGSRRTAGPLIAVATHGIGLLFTPMVLDVYGVATGGRDATPAPQDVLVARLGYRYIYDPQFNYRNFAALGLDVGLDALAVHADAWLALDDDNHRIRQQLDWRLLGDAHDVQDGSRLDAQFALTWHDYGTDGFSVLTGEVALDARYATGRIGPS
ncbi:MAG: hypothetical protein KC620_22150, partial [Myxococcales bacterium]|nr:hypothetical protein [Myxococcales bacterium]